MANLVFKIARYFAYGYFLIALYGFVLADGLTGLLGHCFIGLLLIFVAENLKYIIWWFEYKWKSWDNWKD